MSSCSLKEMARLLSFQMPETVNFQATRDDLCFSVFFFFLFWPPFTTGLRPLTCSSRNMIKKQYSTTQTRNPRFNVFGPVTLDNISLKRLIVHLTLSQARSYPVHRLGLHLMLLLCLQGQRRQKSKSAF